MSNYGGYGGAAGGYGGAGGGYGGSGGQGGGYGQSNPYAQQESRYDQGGNPYAQSGGNPYAQQQPTPPSQPYGGRPQQQGSYNNRYGGQQQQQGRYDDAYGGSQGAGGTAIEMGSVNGGLSQKDRGDILNECESLNAGVKEARTNFDELRTLHSRSVGDVDASGNSPTNQAISQLNNTTMDLTRRLRERVRILKGKRAANHPSLKQQVDYTAKNIERVLRDYQQLDAGYRADLSDQMARQYRIVRPEASDQEVREAVQDTTNTQVFSTALIQSNRRGQAQSALSAVQGRHEAIVKISKQMEELAELFNNMEAIVAEQEPAVERFEHQAEETKQHINHANTHLDGAVDKARAARKKKWICLGIFILIIAIIAAVIAIAVVVTKNK